MLLKEETKLRAERRELNDRQHCVEIEARDIRHQLAVLEEKIQEEYQVPLEEVVKSGASAYVDYLNENYPDWQNKRVDSMIAEIIEDGEDVELSR